jgi:hypothetical protein
LIEGAESPMSLWIELHLEFEDAIGVKNDERTHRILRYAAWCCSDRSGALPNDTSTVAACAFYEHLPTRKDLWRYFPEWFRPQEFEALLPVFSHHLSEEDLAELRKEYYR